MYKCCVFYSQSTGDNYPLSVFSFLFSFLPLLYTSISLLYLLLKHPRFKPILSISSQIEGEIIPFVSSQTSVCVIIFCFLYIYSYTISRNRKRLNRNIATYYTSLHFKDKGDRRIYDQIIKGEKLIKSYQRETKKKKKEEKRKKKRKSFWQIRVSKG